jgi:hypothetical protein
MNKPININEGGRMTAKFDSNLKGLNAIDIDDRVTYITDEDCAELVKTIIMSGILSTKDLQEIVELCEGR